MMQWLYNIFVFLYYVSINIAANFNDKARLWIDGRKNWQEKLKHKIGNHQNVVWFHAASLGEFEQGKPLMEYYRKKNENVFILLTFFSPSGYEIKKHEALADFVMYIPIDRPSRVKTFLDIANPQQAFFIKYEFWFNFLSEIEKRKIPLYLISGIFHQKQVFFKFYGSWFAEKLKAFDRFFLQNETSAQMLSKLNFSNYNVVGDTRFDRVCITADTIIVQEKLIRFVSGKPCLVVGSSWPIDEQFIIEYLNTRPQFKYIIAPHQVDKAHIEKILQQVKLPTLLWSQTDRIEDLDNYNVLLIDTIGQLSKLYVYATWSYIGGAFGSGLHNILEAAVFGSPVVFGPRTKKFHEAQAILKVNGAVQLQKPEDFAATADTLFNEIQMTKEMGENARSFVLQSKGAVNQIIEKIESASRLGL